MKLKYIIISSIVIFNSSFAKVPSKNSNLIGSWYSKKEKILNGKVILNITKKEQFFKNGALLSTKWFNFKTRDGKDLGEYYITKLFSWSADKKIVKARFFKCNTAITKKLKIDPLGYKKLSKQCKASNGSNKITTKSYKIIGDKLYLNKDILISLRDR